MAIKSFLSAVALAATTGMGLSAGVALAQTSTTPAPTGATETPAAPAPAAKVVNDMVLGNAESGLTMIEYASFTCPHCRNWHNTVFKELKRDYIDTGKIKFVYREVYFDRPGLWAGMVARCGGDMRYFGITDMIYDPSAAWLAPNDMAAVAQELRKIGLKAGLSAEQLDVCMSDGEMAQAMMAKFETDSKADDITSTPSFVIDGTKYGNMPYAELKKILDEKLAK